MILRTLFALFILTSIGYACTNEEALKVEGAILEGSGYYEDGLAYDGCASHITLTQNDSISISYAISESSLKLIELELGGAGNFTYKTPVQVRYQLTGLLKEVPCGWGKKSQWKEIQVIEVKKI